MHVFFYVSLVTCNLIILSNICIWTLIQKASKFQVLMWNRFLKLQPVLPLIKNWYLLFSFIKIPKKKKKNNKFYRRHNYREDNFWDTYLRFLIYRYSCTNQCYILILAKFWYKLNLKSNCFSLKPRWLLKPWL